MYIVKFLSVESFVSSVLCLKLASRLWGKFARLSWVSLRLNSGWLGPCWNQQKSLNITPSHQNSRGLLETQKFRKYNRNLLLSLVQASHHSSYSSGPHWAWSAHLGLYEVFLQLCSLDRNHMAMLPGKSQPFFSNNQFFFFFFFSRITQHCIGIEFCLVPQKTFKQQLSFLFLSLCCLQI